MSVNELGPRQGQGHDVIPLIPPSHETAAVTVYCISRLSGPVRFILRYTTPDIHCRDM